MSEAYMIGTPCQSCPSYWQEIHGGEVHEVCVVRDLEGTEIVVRTATEDSCPYAPLLRALPSASEEQIEAFHEWAADPVKNKLVCCIDCSTCGVHRPFRCEGCGADDDLWIAKDSEPNCRSCATPIRVCYGCKDGELFAPKEVSE